MGGLLTCGNSNAGGVSQGREVYIFVVPCLAKAQRSTGPGESHQRSVEPSPMDNMMRSFMNLLGTIGFCCGSAEIPIGTRPGKLTDLGINSSHLSGA